jgi:homoserine O-succinyltransferase
MAEHPLMQGVGERMLLPHTRWNQVDETELIQAGYRILSRSEEAGVGFFINERRNSWLFCQGHPEYEGADLLREYRRDVGRFLSGQRPTYPDLPRSYFRHADVQALLALRKQAVAHRDVSVMQRFPRIEQGAPTWDAWRPAAVVVFGNWLKQIAAQRAGTDLAHIGFNTDPALAEEPQFVGDAS